MKKAFSLYSLTASLLIAMIFAALPANALLFHTNEKGKDLGNGPVFSDWSMLSGFFDIKHSYYIPTEAENAYYENMGEGNRLKPGSLHDIKLVLTGTPDGLFEIKVVIIGSPQKGREPEFDNEFKHDNPLEKFIVFPDFKKHQSEILTVYRFREEKDEDSGKSLAVSTPTPEPASMILGLLGIAGAFGFRRFN